MPDRPDGMNDVFGREQIASGDLGFTHISVSKGTAGFHQFCSRRAVDCAVQLAAT